MPRQAFLLLNMPAFTGHTTGRAVFPHPAFMDAYGSALLFVIALAFFAASLIFLLLEVRIAIKQLDNSL